MDKWAHYLVSCVEQADGIITSLVVHTDNGEKIGSGIIYPAEEVIKAINKGVSFVTIEWNYDKANWMQGAKIGVEKKGGKEHLRTYENDKWTDDLKHLPPVHYSKDV